MRPIRLELSAFGPYLEHTVIDFEKLNEAGLFLITGQTGGGKTTLLDAMSIALFYKSSLPRFLRRYSARRKQYSSSPSAK